MEPVPATTPCSVTSQVVAPFAAPVPKTLAKPSKIKGPYPSQLDPYTDKKSSKSSVDTTLSPFKSPVHVTGMGNSHVPSSIPAVASKFVAAT